MIAIHRTNTILYCRDFAGCTEFYATRLGFPVSFRSDWLVEFATSSEACLSVADVSRTRQPTTRGVTVTFEVEEVTILQRRLLAEGVSATELRNRSDGTRGFLVTDPDGNRIEFWCRENREAGQARSRDRSPGGC